MLASFLNPKSSTMACFEGVTILNKNLTGDRLDTNVHFYMLSVWGYLIFFFYFHFYACFGMLLKDLGESFLLSEDKPLTLTPNIDGVMAL